MRRDYYDVTTFSQPASSESRLLTIEYHIGLTPPRSPPEPPPGSAARSESRVRWQYPGRHRESVRSRRRQVDGAKPMRARPCLLRPAQ